MSSCTTTTDTLQVGAAGRVKVKARERDPVTNKLQAVNLTGATIDWVRIAHADAPATLELTGLAVDDATNGILGGDADAGVLAYAGTWQVQAAFTLSGEPQRLTEVGSFTVKANLPTP